MTITKHPAAANAPLSFECELADPPEKVWRALTEPELLAAWLMPNDIKPAIGERFAFAGPNAPIECEVLEAEPGKLLRYSWRERPGVDTADRLPAFDGPIFESIVTFTLARTVSGGTHLRIVHDGFATVAQPVVAVSGAGCGISLHARKSPAAANAPSMMLRAA
ncbi:MAG: SRPBCC domain-containing protein [Mesorhizobium sp.]|uniref:SRPBCC family protein n=6 Tax=Mesorhizobium TaxID=68287 RepID=UPI000F74D946|nr:MULTISPECIES: SRPBCC domain-containing protein [unclassified Mesorhizobium]TGV88388.1 SRPBCC domain-containing protein [Mesorhizobium sp. M00.F.Ca.ET.158.01.1.1]AZO62827.1 SRPBCC domain-containing protein [Mesorhizobium sp. M1A.F.Ca.IN.022.06.1.1]MCT2578755.1 SRPBCC domain-containing protein [Mesorhizobium sp. P13.3]MDF3167230.1 SRPBCC domain-containing protein [Mesorhizobium sp. P16.1]MDF3179240.1 SRPBCC domain-containing protein [Mesorhizobium sp. P17.1]